MEDQDQQGALGAAMGYEGLDELMPDPAAAAETPIEYARGEYEAAKGQREKAFSSVLSEITAAKQRLLAQPTELTRAQYVQGLARKLTATPERTDPRFYERRNLYTFLRDVGQYGSDVEEAQKAAKLKQAEEAGKLSQLMAKYQLEDAQKREAAAMGLLGKARAAAAPKPLPAEVQAFQYYQGILDDPNAPAAQKSFARDWLNKQTYIAPQKSEPDPDRPSSTVIARVQTAAGRNLNPIKVKLDSLNQAKTLLSQAYTNPAAVPQLDRYLASLVGDRQLSALEVRSIANVGSLPERIANKVGMFISGTPTDLSLDDKKKVLDAIEDYLAPQFNAQHDRVMDSFASASDISPTVVSKILGGKYVTEAEKRRKKQAEKPVEAALEAPQKDESASTHTTQKGTVVKKIG